MRGSRGMDRIEEHPRIRGFRGMRAMRADLRGRGGF